MNRRIVAIAAATLAGTVLAAASGEAEEQRRRPMPIWSHDYIAKDTFGPHFFAVRPVSDDCETRLGTHVTSRRLFTQSWMRSRPSYCR